MKPEDRVVSMDIEATDGRARAGVVHTATGSFRTPCFMPVGTRGAVRTLAADDLEDLGAQVVLANTYHLMLRPGPETVAQLGGLHGFTGWGGLMLTDSGGFQVFSLEPDVDDDGVTFRSTYDGSSHRLTPESAVEVQSLLGADIQMVLDVCPPLPSPPGVVQTAVDRTARWAERAAKTMVSLRAAGSTQALFGIVQGGTDCELRRQSAQRTCAIGFDGYGIGGFSVGEPRAEMLPALEVVLDVIPVDQPRYLMGVGDPIGMIEAVALGVDMFDCVLPTRLARHGTILTDSGRLNLRNVRWANDPDPLDETCTCPTCRRYSKAYIRHLLKVQEPTAARLTTLHNVHWTLRLIERARDAVLRGELDELRGRLAESWE